MRSVVEAFRIPGTKGADFIDDPALAASRFALVAMGFGSAMGFGIRDWGFERVTEAFGFADTLGQEQIDIVQQELTPFGECDDARCATGGEIGRLSEDPRVAQNAAPDEHPFHA